MTRGSFSDESLWGTDAADSRSRLDPSIAPRGADRTLNARRSLSAAGRCSSSRAPVRARPECSRVASRTCSRRATRDPTRSWRSPSPTRRPTRCVDASSIWSGPDADRMWVSTFHSACLRMLRAHADVLGYERGFTIYDAGDAETAVERIMKELNLDTKRLPPRSVSAAISAAKNEMISPDRYFDVVRRRPAAPAHRRDLPALRRAAAARPTPWTSTTCS